MANFVTQQSPERFALVTNNEQMENLGHYNRSLAAGVEHLMDRRMQVGLPASDDGDGARIFFVEELSRPNALDGFQSDFRITTQPIAKADAAVRAAMAGAVKEIVMPFSNSIRRYNPETDIHHRFQPFVLTEDVADCIENSGISVRGVADDYCNLESIPALPGQRDVIAAINQGKDAEDDAVEQLGKVIKKIQSTYNYHAENARIAGMIAPQVNFAKLDILKIIGEGHENQLVLTALKAHEAELSQALVGLANIRKKIGAAKGELIGENVKRITLPSLLNVQDVFPGLPAPTSPAEKPLEFL